MRELKRIAVSALRPDPEQPRKSFDEAELVALADSLKRHGQLVPIITVGDKVIDGERRWRALPLAGIDHVEALVLDARPSATELQLLQMNIDAHRTNLTAVERSDFLAKIKRETGWSVQELAAHTGMKQPFISKLLKFQEACPEVKAALSSSSLDIDKAYTICQEPDPQKQRELLGHARDLNREQLRQKARAGGQPVEARASVARFQLPRGVMVTVQGRRMTLDSIIDALAETAKQLRKGQADQLDLPTLISILRDKAKASM